MSLLLAYHDSKRAVVCSDDRGIRFNQAGQAEPVAERIPKFVQAGDFIFASLGRSDVAATLLRGTALMIAAQPQVTIASLGEILPGILKEAFSRRPRRDVSNVPLGVESDGIETALLGFDHDSGRVRAFICASVDDFAPVETTADPYARIFALGAYGPDDHPLLLRLTERMKVAAKMHIPWIASELRTTAGEMHRRYPVAVGQPSYFAALDANGFVSLPENFPPLPSPVPELHHAVHLVTTNKEQALNAAGQFFLGSIMTPRAGAPDTIGNNDGGSGAQSGQLNILLMSASATNGLGGSGILGNGAVTNLPNSVDGDLTTKGTLTVTGNGAGNEAIGAALGSPGNHAPLPDGHSKTSRCLPDE